MKVEQYSVGTSHIEAVYANVGENISSELIRPLRDKAFMLAFPNKHPLSGNQHQIIEEWISRISTNGKIQPSFEKVEGLPGCHIGILDETVLEFYYKQGESNFAALMHPTLGENPTCMKGPCPGAYAVIEFIPQTSI